MTDEEIQELARLLRQLAAEGLGLPRLPGPVFGALKGVVAMPTVELLISRDARDLLYTPRHDKHWDGWHIPGGFLGVDESLEAACLRIGQRELGVPVTMQRLIGHHTWPAHPYATAISLLCVCSIEEAPREGQYFAELPPKLIPEHRAMLERWWPPR